jgi:predicted GNAT family N-acyltransferase
MSIPAWNEVAIHKSHDRRGFDCGQADLNTFLAQHARQAHEQGISKTYAAVNATDKITIFGFYTLSPAQVELARVPDLARPKGGRYPVSGFRLGRLAVSRSLQRVGLGGQLLVAAAVRCMRVSSEIGGTALMIDAKDQAAADWYALYGAVPLNDAPLSLVLPYDVFRAALHAAGKQI